MNENIADTKETWPLPTGQPLFDIEKSNKSVWKSDAHLHRNQEVQTYFELDTTHIKPFLFSTV